MVMVENAEVAAVVDEEGGGSGDDPLGPSKHYAFPRQTRSEIK